MTLRILARAKSGNGVRYRVMCDCGRMLWIKANALRDAKDCGKCRSGDR